MGTIGAPIWSVVLITAIAIAISSSSACDRCVHYSKASYTDDKNFQPGACGYRSLKLGFNAGATASNVFNAGLGCGGCYQIKCTNSDLCSDKGTTFIVTQFNDINKKNDFVLSREAFKGMAKGTREAQELLKKVAVDVEYKRVPCAYQTKQKIYLRIQELSLKPFYLSVQILYLAGQTEIVAVKAAQYGKNNWVSLSRSYAAIWGTNSKYHTTVNLQFKFTVISGRKQKEYLANYVVIPKSWNNTGEVYSTGLQINDIEQETCKGNSHCDNGKWKSASTSQLRSSRGSN